MKYTVGALKPFEHARERRRERENGAEEHRAKFARHHRAWLRFDAYSRVARLTMDDTSSRFKPMHFLKKLSRENQNDLWQVSLHLHCHRTMFLTTESGFDGSGYQPDASIHVLLYCRSRAEAQAAVKRERKSEQDVKLK